MNWVVPKEFAPNAVATGLLVLKWKVRRWTPALAVIATVISTRVRADIYTMMAAKSDKLSF